MVDTVKTALVGGIFALLGVLGGAAVTGWSQVELAKQKFNSDLVLRALESDSPEQRLQTLRLLVETNLLKDSEIKQGVRNYAIARENNPSAIPQVAPSQSFEPPVISNPRIYLLAGNRSKKSLIAPYRQELEAAGFRVLGAKIIQDEGRPAHEEVRYFYPEDRRQAVRIAEVVKFKLSIQELPVRMYSDSSVQPGYIEIWFGRGDG